MLIVECCKEKQEEVLTLEDAVCLCQSRIEGGMSKKDAVKLVSSKTGFPKNALHEAVLK